MDNMQQFYFGYIPDQPDARDYRLKTTPQDVLPSTVDLRQLLQPIKNQGRLGACTAFATTAMVEYVRNKQNLVAWDASPLFTYYATRKIENTINSDSGASVRDALKSAVNDGVVKEITWPYVVENFTITPPASAWEEAEKHQALTYLRIDQTKESVLNCLADGYPFTFGAKLYSSFMKTQTGFLVWNTVPMPNLSAESLVGGHCMLAVGYLSASDDSIQIIVRNSWGTNVGLDGYHQIPIEYILSPDLSFDFWTIRSEEINDDVIITPPTPEPDPIPMPPDLKPQPPVPIPPTPDPVPPVPVPVPPTPAPDAPESIWKKPTTYVIIGVVIILLLFVLL